MDDSVIVHVGPVKTGSTLVQDLLWRERGDLARQGVLHPCLHDNEMWYAANDVQDEAFIHFDLPECRGAWGAVVDRVRRHRGPCILSHELLGFSTNEHVRRIADDLAPRPLRIVIHARALASILPSTYQEKVKMVDPDVAWEDWLGQQRESRAAWCDTAGIVARWTPYVPAEHIHVVTVPPDRTDPGLLLYRFGVAASIDTSSWDIMGAATNPSLDLEQIELLRLINQTTAATMDVNARRRFVNGSIIPRLGAPNAGRKRRISVSERAWIEAETDRRIDALAASKATVHGDLTDLRCPDSSWTDRSAEVDQERVTRLAIRTLVDVSTRPDEPSTTDSAQPTGLWNARS